MSPTDPFDLRRFLDAQDDGATFDRALGELRRGRKTSHWMWFVFPQIAGLGRSSMAQRFAVTSLAEAEAFVRHPVLGPRLIECADALLATRGQTAEQILGGIDAMKLHSSMTLFLSAAPDIPQFGMVLEKFFAGEPDPATQARI